MGEIKRQKEKSQPFPDDTYQNLTIDDLILYALFSLEKKGVEGRFENIVAEGFEMFPKKFYLHGYPEYPDARRVFNSVMRMSGGLPTNQEKLIVGNMKSFFTLTERGLERLKAIQMKLQTGEDDKIGIKTKIEDKRGKMGRMLWEIETHPLYRQYLINGENTDIPETLLRNLLFATMETPKKRLEEKMSMLIGYCESLGRDDIKKFLIFCKNKHKEIFS
ncbi:hypothetical protein J7L48_00870 [bacterium]|nr:hypothetical protein [bacterium]